MSALNPPSKPASSSHRTKARSSDGCVAPSPHSESAAAESAPAKAASSKPATKPAKEERLSTKPKQASKPGQGTNDEIAKKVSDLPTNVPVDGDAATYRDFLLKLNPIATTVNRAKIQLAWIYGEALNAFIASPHYKRGDYTKLLADIGMSWTKAHYVRMLAERFTLATALKRPSYSDLLREMKQLPDREPKHGQERGIGDRMLDEVDPPDDVRGDENEDTGKGEGKAKGKKPPKGGRPPLAVTHETVLLRLEEIKAQAIKIKTMNPPNIELADATALYDRIRSETVEINRLIKDIHDIADDWVNKNGAYVPPTEGKN